MFKRLLQKYRRFLKFGVVGCINTVVDLLVFTLCSELAHLSPAWSQGIGYAAGIVCSFVLNHSFTFADAKKETAVGESFRFARFVAVNGVSLLLSTGLMHVFTQWGLWKYAAKAVVTVVTMLVNYFGYKLLVFHIKDKK